MLICVPLPLQALYETLGVPWKEAAALGSPYFHLIERADGAVLAAIKKTQIRRQELFHTYTEISFIWARFFKEPLPSLPDLLSHAAEGVSTLMPWAPYGEDGQLSLLLSQLVSENRARISAEQECSESKRINWIRHGDYFSDEFIEAFFYEKREISPPDYGEGPEALLVERVFSAPELVELILDHLGDKDCFRFARALGNQVNSRFLPLKCVDMARQNSFLAYDQRPCFPAVYGSGLLLAPKRLNWASKPPTYPSLTNDSNFIRIPDQHLDKMSSIGQVGMLKRISFTRLETLIINDEWTNDAFLNAVGSKLARPLKRLFVVSAVTTSALEKICSWQHTPVQLDIMFTEPSGLPEFPPGVRVLAATLQFDESRAITASTKCCIRSKCFALRVNVLPTFDQPQPTIRILDLRGPTTSNLDMATYKSAASQLPNLKILRTFGHCPTGVVSLFPRLNRLTINTATVHSRFFDQLIASNKAPFVLEFINVIFTNEFDPVVDERQVQIRRLFKQGMVLCIGAFCLHHAGRSFHAEMFVDRNPGVIIVQRHRQAPVILFNTTAKVSLDAALRNYTAQHLRKTMKAW